MLSFIDKVTTMTWSLALFSWNIPLIVAITNSSWIGQTFGSTTLNILDISDITQYFANLIQVPFCS